MSASRSIVMLPDRSAVVPRMQRDRDRERLVEQPLLAVDLHHAHQVLGRARVDLAAVLARIDEGAQPHLGERAGAVRRRCRGRAGDHARAAGCRPRSCPSTASAPSFGTSDQWPPTTRFTRPSCARRLRPRSLPSPGRRGEHQREVARRARSRGSAARARRSARRACRCRRSPRHATVSPSRMIAIASAAETILFFTMRPPRTLPDSGSPSVDRRAAVLRDLAPTSRARPAMNLAKFSGVSPTYSEPVSFEHLLELRRPS